MPHVTIRVKGQIDPRWSEWFGDLHIQPAESDQTILTGHVIDQASLYGLLAKLRDLGLQLMWVKCEEAESGD